VKLFGKKNPAWKENPSYSALHARVYSRRGKATKCEICGKTTGKIEWASTGSLKDVSKYKAMCASCHAKYDKDIKNLRRRKK